MKLPFKQPASTFDQRAVAERFEILLKTLAALMIKTEEAELSVGEEEGEACFEQVLIGNDNIRLAVGILCWDSSDEEPGTYLALRLAEDSINLDYTLGKGWTISFFLEEATLGESSPGVVAARGLGIDIGLTETHPLTQERAIQVALALGNYFLEHRNLA